MPHRWFARKNYSGPAEVFTWGPEDMSRVSRSVITHRLAVDPTHRPVKQKCQHLSAERKVFIKKRVEMLPSIGHIRETMYPEWLANVVLAPKPLTWWMCVDYTNLNKDCPQDPFPLPRTNQLIDETTGCELFSFMDAFKRYHQIFMAEEDDEKIAFVTTDGVYCYWVMAFRLKNSRSAFTRMVVEVFKDLLGNIMEAYVDDILVKSMNVETHPEYLTRCFEAMEQHNLCLNPKKCASAVTRGKFLGFMVTHRGIEVNLEKAQNILK